MDWQWQKQIALLLPYNHRSTWPHIWYWDDMMGHGNYISILVIFKRGLTFTLNKQCLTNWVLWNYDILL
jgi:hypothetical protein